MKHNSFLKLLLGIPAILCLLLAVSAFSTNKEGDEAILINHRPINPPGGPRSPQSVEIVAYYNSDVSCVFATLSNAGVSVTVELVNITNDEYYDYVIPGTGLSVLPISGNSGLWTITFTLADGDVYEGEFDL